MAADDFLVAPSNEAAVAWLDRWPDWPGPALVVHGPPGCGKSHLTQVWRARSQAGLVAADQLDVATVPVVLGSVGRVAVDGAHALAGDPAGERALLHLYNLARERGGSLLLTAGRAPAQWQLALPDLRSRLLAAPVVALGPPDDRLLAAVLVKLFADRQLKVPIGVIDYLVARMERSFAAARSLVAALDRAALALQRPITVPLARDVLAEGQPEEE